MATDEELIKEGKSALRRDYYGSMTSFAKEILEQAKKEGYEDLDEAREWIGEQIDETADSTSWVIYTASALDVMVASDNWLQYDEWLDDTGEAPPSDVAQFVTRTAFFAVRQDIWDQLEAYEDEYFTESEENPRRRKKKSKKRSRKRKNPQTELVSRLLR